MRSKCFAVLVACMLLVGVASAQEYAIRANTGLNLRAAPSLDADIADTAPSGSILQVVGEFGRWLKINRFGNEVWLADWVDFSRVDSGEPTQAQQSTAPIDNCCFVDRQCQSEAEWEAGYWAYQSNECPAASAQPQPATLAQPAANASARPRVEGSARFVRRIEAVLDFMQNEAPEWYSYIVSGFDLISERPDNYPNCGSFQATAHGRERQTRVDTCMAFSHTGYRGDLIFVAGVLAHEACHIHHYEAGTVYPGGIWEEELECSKPSQALGKLLDPAGRYINYWYDPDFVINRLRDTGCFQKINSYDEFYRVLENFSGGRGADYTC